MKLGLMFALWLLVAYMAVPMLESAGVLDGSFLNGLLGTAFNYLGMDEQATHFFELYSQ
jgi:hypothetical protein